MNILPTAKSLFYTCSISFLFISSITILSAQEIPDSASDAVDFSGYVSFAQMYDDNVIDYSLNDLVLLGSIPKPVKFSVDKPMDNIYVGKLRLSLSTPLFMAEPTVISLRYRQYIYGVGTIKNYFSWELGVKQFVSKTDYVSVGFNLLPHFYVRNVFYKHPNPNPNGYRSRYVEETINKKGFDLVYGKRLSRRLSATIGYEYENTQYNKDFSERTNLQHLISLGATVNISRVIGTSVSYRFATSSANGRDIKDSTIADISTREHRIGLGLDVSLKPVFRIPVKISNDFSYENQTYLSEKKYVHIDSVDVFNNPIIIDYGDKYHYGRIDNLYRISTEVSYRFMRAFNVFLQYVWEQHRTNLPETSDAGSYHDHQFGGGVEYSF